jgi:hypothetical protein
MGKGEQMKIEDRIDQLEKDIKALSVQIVKVADMSGCALLRPERSLVIEGHGWPSVEFGRGCVKITGFGKWESVTIDDDGKVEYKCKY